MTPEALAAPCWLYSLNFPNGKRYFGISSNMRKRKIGHLVDMRAGSELPLHRALRKFGPDSVEWKPLVLGPRSYIIVAYRTRERAYGYNVGLGGEHSPMLVPEVASKISIAAKLRNTDPAYRAKNSAQALLRWQNLEFREKMRAAREGRRLSPEHRANIGKGIKNYLARNPRSKNRVDS